MGVPNVMRGVYFQWTKDVRPLLGHPICDCTPAGYYGSEDMPCLCILQNPYNFGGPVPVR